MDVKAALVSGLTSDPRRLPVWFRYDKQGSIYNDRFLTDNTHYYFYRSEVEVLTTNVQAIVSEVAPPCVLVEMGSGNSEKSRMIIDVILRQQTTLNYIPVDISAEFLKETADSLSHDYGEKLRVTPVPGDYTVGIEHFRQVEGRKLIVWLGGGFQNQPYNVQVARLHSMAQSMTGADRLLVALDVTQEAEAVERAYLDPTGVGENLYLNSLWRLNREYGSDIITDNFRLEANFDHSTEDDTLSGVKLRAVSCKDQEIHIPDLNLTFDLPEGDCIYLHEGEYLSCKYTDAQVRSLAEKAGLTLNRIWTDPGRHVGLFCFAKDV